MKQSFLEDVMLELIRIYWGSSVGDQARDRGGRLSGKESSCQGRRYSSVLGLGRSPGGGNGNPLQYSCLGNLMNRGAWWGAVHGVAEMDTSD